MFASLRFAVWEFIDWRRLRSLHFTISVEVVSLSRFSFGKAQTFCLAMPGVGTYGPTKSLEKLYQGIFRDELWFSYAKIEERLWTVLGAISENVWFCNSWSCLTYDQSFQRGNVDRRPTAIRLPKKGFGGHTVVMSKFTNGLKSSILIKNLFYFLDIILIHNDLRNFVLNFFL